MHNVGEFVNEIEWSPWRKTFVFTRKETITGKTAIGLVWFRTGDTRVMEYEDYNGYFVASTGEILEYARDKKEIFWGELNGRAVD